jgi:hypothetical protein
MGLNWGDIQMAGPREIQREAKWTAEWREAEATRQRQWEDKREDWEGDSLIKWGIDENTSWLRAALFKSKCGNTTGSAEGGNRLRLFHKLLFMVILTHRYGRLVKIVAPSSYFLLSLVYPNISFDYLTLIQKLDPYTNIYVNRLDLLKVGWRTGAWRWTGAGRERKWCQIGLLRGSCPEHGWSRFVTRLVSSWFFHPFLLLFAPIIKPWLIVLLLSLSLYISFAA